MLAVTSSMQFPEGRQSLWLFDVVSAFVWMFEAGSGYGALAILILEGSASRALALTGVGHHTQPSPVEDR